jgi:hypothetical protein
MNFDFDSYVLNSITLIPLAVILKKKDKVFIFDRETITSKIQLLFYSFSLNRYVNSIIFLSANESLFSKNLKIKKIIIPELYNQKRILTFSFSKFPKKTFLFLL